MDVRFEASPNIIALLLARKQLYALDAHGEMVRYSDATSFLESPFENFYDSDLPFFRAYDHNKGMTETEIFASNVSDQFKNASHHVGLHGPVLYNFRHNFGDHLRIAGGREGQAVGLGHGYKWDVGLRCYSNGVEDLQAQRLILRDFEDGSEDAAKFEKSRLQKRIRNGRAVEAVVLAMKPLPPGVEKRKYNEGLTAAYHADSDYQEVAVALAETKQRAAAGRTVPRKEKADRERAYKQHRNRVTKVFAAEWERMRSDRKPGGTIAEIDQAFNAVKVLLSLKPWCIRTPEEHAALEEAMRIREGAHSDVLGYFKGDVEDDDLPGETPGSDEKDDAMERVKEVLRMTENFIPGREALNPVEAPQAQSSAAASSPDGRPAVSPACADNDDVDSLANTPREAGKFKDLRIMTDVDPATVSRLASRGGGARGRPQRADLVHLPAAGQLPL